MILTAVLLTQATETETPVQDETRRQPGFSQEDKRFSAGGALVFGTEDGSGLGLRGEFRYLREWVPKLTVGAEFVVYSGESVDFSFSGSPFSVDYRLFELSAIAHYQLVERGPWQTYGLGGLGFATLDADVEAGATTPLITVEDQSALALHFGGGANYALTSSLDAFAEVRFTFYVGGGSDDGSAELGSNGQLAGGVRYMF